MKSLIFLLFTALLLSGCTKMEDKKNTTDKAPTNTAPNTPNPHGTDKMGELGKTEGNFDMQTESGKDPKAEEVSKTAYDFEKTYEKSKTDANKKQLVEKHMAAGNYLMFEANVPPKDKYRPALKHYKRVLQLDPSNDAAQKNKQQIEDIYNMMGRPIPQD